MRWMHQYRMNRYAMSKCLKQSVMQVESQIKCGKEFQDIRPATENASVKLETWYGK